MRDGVAGSLLGLGLAVGLLFPPPAPGDLTPSTAPQTQSSATVDPVEISAQGQGVAQVHIATFGRYALTVKSAQGVAIRLVDRMVGPQETSGVAGERDGRLDVLLDRGDYRLLTTGDDRAQGRAQLAVHAFAERNVPALRLVELKPVSAHLGDLEQRSYWIYIPAPRWVYLEAAGRNLRDLRLWRDGTWLVDASASSELLVPKTGRPLRHLQLAAKLDPGYYRLTAYGGPAEPWAEQDDAHPFHLRWGIPHLATAGRARHEASPFGLDHWLIPARASYFRLELPESLPATLQVLDYDETALHPAPAGSGPGVASIDKDSRVAVAEVETASRAPGLRMVTVRAEAGQSYVLQHFQATRGYRFSGGGEYWLSTLHAGEPADSVDATAILVRIPHGKSADKIPAAVRVIEVGPGHGWARRCNLLEPLSVFVRIGRTGRYRVDVAGPESRHRFEPLLLTPPADYQPPSAEPSGAVWDLDAGLYRLSVTPVEKGVATIGIAAEDEATPPPGPPRGSARFGAQALDAGGSYLLLLNEQPGVKAGVVLRRIPLDLSQALPLSLAAGEVVEIPFAVDEPSTLAARPETGGLLPLSLDGQPWQETMAVSPGSHRVAVRYPGEGAVHASLVSTPVRLAEAVPLPPMPQDTLAELPQFPILTAGAPRFLDLEAKGSRTFRVRADRDALYRLETTGLLATAGTLRSRVQTSLAKSTGGGTGRNFLLHSFLRAGDYQVTVRARGTSAGHLGIALTDSHPRAGGELREGIPARAALAAGEAIAYDFTIAEPGKYRLRALAQEGTPRGRLEDAGGWPLLRPGLPINVTRAFEAGGYRLVLLPEAVVARRVTLLERVPPPLHFEGHGPHVLPLDTRVEHLWREPQPGAARIPDAWDFELPARVETTVTLEADMQARLLRLAPEGARLVATGPRGWHGILPQGHYRLETTAARMNNRLPYAVTVRPKALVAGTRRAVSAPARVAVAVGSGGLTDLYSLGGSDVRARLSDEAGTLVAQSDDREADWNFDIAAALPAGSYVLAVDPVGKEQAQTELRMQTRLETQHQALEPPATLRLTGGTAVHLYPLASPPAADMIIASAASGEAVGMAVEAQQAGRWRVLAQDMGRAARLAVTQPDEPVRLRVWSAEGRQAPIELSVTALLGPELDEAALVRGSRLAAVRGSGLAPARVRLQRPGTLRIRPADTRVALAPGQGLKPVRDGLATTESSTLWLAADAPGAKAQVRAERVRLGDRELKLPVDGAGAVDLEAGGLALVLATSPQANPAVRVVGSRGGHVEHSVGASALVAHAAAAVGLVQGRGSAVVWLPAGGRADVSLRLRSYPRPAAEAAAFGTLAGALSGVQARAYVLPAGPKRIRIAASPGIVAAAADGESVRGVYWAGTESLAETFQTTARTLYVLHAGEQEDRYTVEVLPAESATALTPGERFEERLPRAGTRRLKVSGPGALQISGAARSLRFVSADGRIQSGDVLEVGASGGTLWILHGPGVVSVAWREGTRGAPIAGRPVWLPARLDLEGSSQAFRVTLGEPVLLRVASEAGAEVRVTAGDHTTARLQPLGGVLAQYLPAGSATVELRALAGGGLSGALELTSTTLTPLEEGLGPELLLPPGGAHAFRFSLSRDGSIGVGARAEPDTVQVELLDASGSPLGQGTVQMHTLKAGDYVLVVRAPADGWPVRVRPAVVGVLRPPTGPPEEVIRRYRDMAKTEEDR